MSTFPQVVVTDQRVSLFSDLFVNRTDVWATQYVGRGKHGYVAKRETLTAEAIQKHLAGAHTIGLYALSGESAAKWLTVDIDRMVPAEAVSIRRRASELGLPDPLVELSGMKGMHLWLFFGPPTPGWQARELGKLLTGDHEVFPKQDAVSRDTSRPGSLVKAPMGIHRVSGKWSCFLDSNFNAIEDAWSLLADVPKVSADLVNRLVGSTKPSEGTPVCRPRTSRRLRPCIEQALRDGTRQGLRNDTAHILACEMRWLRQPKPVTAGMLACWNLRNLPPLGLDELNAVIDHAYSGRNYSHSCARNGRLRRALQCIGPNACPYMETWEAHVRQQNSGDGCTDAESHNAKSPEPR